MLTSIKTVFIYSCMVLGIISFISLGDRIIWVNEDDLASGGMQVEYVQNNLKIQLDDKCHISPNTHIEYKVYPDYKVEYRCSWYESSAVYWPFMSTAQGYVDDFHGGVDLLRSTDH